jgi:hypothetical protein
LKLKFGPSEAVTETLKSEFGTFACSEAVSVLSVLASVLFSNCVLLIGLIF